jgi:hypothetical protein
VIGMPYDIYDLGNLELLPCCPRQCERASKEVG